MSLGEALLIAASLVTMPAALKRPSPRLYKNGRPCPHSQPLFLVRNGHLSVFIGNLTLFFGYLLAQLKKSL